MTKKDLLKKHGLNLLAEVKFWEDCEPFKPFIYKAQHIAKTAGVTIEVAEEALKDYQHFMEI